MSTIIFSCNRGLAVQGAIALNSPIFKTKIFVDDPINLIGFRRYLPYHYDKSTDTQYLEIAYFMEMLYEGNYEGFEILKTKKEDIDLELYDFEILKKREEDLVSQTLVDRLKAESFKIYNSLTTEKEVFFSNEKLAFDLKNSYLCIRNLMLAIQILQFKKVELTGNNELVLQGILDGRFTVNGIKEGWENYNAKIKELEEVSDLPLNPDINLLNDIILEIRDIKWRD